VITRCLPDLDDLDQLGGLESQVDMFACSLASWSRVIATESACAQSRSVVGGPSPLCIATHRPPLEPADQRLLSSGFASARIFTRFPRESPAVNGCRP